LPAFDGANWIAILSGCFFLVIVGTPPQLLTWYYGNIETPSLNFFYNAYTPLEFVGVYFLFRRKLLWRSSRRILFYSAVIYIGVCFFYIFNYGMVRHFLEHWSAVNNLAYILWILVYLQEQFSADGLPIHRRSPFAWYILALMVYAPGTLIVFCLYYYLRNHPGLMGLWGISDLCNILLYVLFAAGLLVSRRSSVEMRI